MSPFRPDLIDVWVFRAGGVAGLEILLLRRAPGRILPGLWQCVSGSLASDETVVAGALRELAEETDLRGPAIEALYDLDQVNQFHEPSVDGILTAAIFAARVRPTAAVARSHEHDDHRWVAPDDALRLVVWPAYRDSIRRIREDLAHPGRARWFELTLEGRRLIV